MSLIFHNRLSHEQALQRFQAFCEEPMLHHVLHYCVAVLHDQTSNSLTLSRRLEMLWHKFEAIRLLNEALTNIDDCNIELVICTVMYLTGLDLEKRESEHTLLFRAHPWQALWPWIDGQKLPVKTHVDALQTLVNKRGGLEALQMPGLALSIARSDLVYHSLWLAAPRFPSIWTLDADTLAAYQGVQLSAPQLPTHGLSAIAGMLPISVVDALVNVANTERLLNNHLDVFSLDQRQMEAVRCLAHHQVLCLPAWDDTDGIYSDWADETVYELCRLAGMLYSNAVILGLPPHEGWHLRLCERIRACLEACDVEELSEDAPGLLVWVLFLGSTAAVGSGEEGFFVGALRTEVEREGLVARGEVEAVLEGYLWSGETCGEGGEVVFGLLGMQ